ncbi:MAG TPA: 2,3,4,5-tetrahydropyridine-2,6-dicarboxylate N-succinyltransferase, partial [Gemmatimonadota bacterium]|nr:2,3,4,5-tetrahydropyridine-2,6-dicarboxylate N-succinyltransferase [Gemmatimonadota bacterium]
MIQPDALRQQIERWAAQSTPSDPQAARQAVHGLLAALSDGSVRAAELGPEGWQAVEWVKAGILLAFRVGVTARYDGPAQEYFDRDTLPLRRTEGQVENVRVVPGGTSVRDGTYLAPGVVIMPPAYI